MESSGNAPGMQPWQAYFGTLSFKPHAGQREAFDDAAQRDRGDRLLKLPTGYGKTRTAAGIYTIRRSRGIVNRCLWLVATDTQREQLVPTPKRDGSRGPTVSDNLPGWFGTSCKETFRAEGYRAVRMHQEGFAEVFVATYQQALYDRVTIPTLLETGHWLIVADEAHHLKEEGKWAQRVQELAGEATEILYMTATPLRADELPLHGVPSKLGPDGKLTYDAFPDINWRQAMDEHAIRRPQAHAQEWEITLEDQHGKPVTLTTTDLLEKIRADQIETGLDDYMIKRRLRFTSQYVHGMFVDAVSRLQEKRSRWPGTHQMLVYALNCSHAKFLAQQVFAPLVGKHDADWMGVTRSDAENHDVLNRYMDGDLSVLVQVNKAGEGFDNPPTSVLVFLDLTKSEPTIYQKLGRGARRLWEIPPEHDILDVYADTSHPVIAVVKKLEPDDGPYGDIPKPRGPDDDDLDWCPADSLEELETRYLQTFLWAPDGAPSYSREHFDAATAHGVTPEQVEDILRRFRMASAPANEPQGESGRLAYRRDQVDRLLSTVTGHAIRVIRAKHSARFDANPSRMAAMIKKNLNSQWIVMSGKPHSEMLSGDFEEKHKWLAKVDGILHETKGVPGWLVRGL